MAAMLGRVTLRGDAGSPSVREVTLTLVSPGDDIVLRKEGLAALRKKRLLRLCMEAREQGILIGYTDLARLLFTSVSTLKRDVVEIERSGITVPLKGRRSRSAGSREALAR